jgi:hypothetical protein
MSLTFSELGGLAKIPNDPQGTFLVIWECSVCLSNRKPVDFLSTTTTTATEFEDFKKPTSTTTFCFASATELEDLMSIKNQHPNSMHATHHIITRKSFQFFTHSPPPILVIPRNMTTGSPDGNINESNIPPPAEPLPP